MTLNYCFDGTAQAILKSPNTQGISENAVIKITYRAFQNPLNLSPCGRAPEQSAGLRGLTKYIQIAAPPHPAFGPLPLS